MKKYHFCKNCKIMFNGNKVVIGNTLDGRWIRISKECYEILVEGMDKELEIQEVIENFEEEEDRTYIQSLFQCLYDMDVIRQEGEKEPIPKRGVVIALTHKCNLKCIHCFVEASPEAQEELSYTEIISIIDKICKSDIQYISFTGGEPLVRKDCLKILEYTKQHFSGQICLMTNGTLITENNVKRIVEYVDAIDISIDGVDEEVSKHRTNNL